MVEIIRQEDRLARPLRAVGSPAAQRAEQTLARNPRFNRFVSPLCEPSDVNNREGPEAAGSTMKSKLPIFPLTTQPARLRRMHEVASVHSAAMRRQRHIAGTES